METPQHLSLNHVQGSQRVLSACCIHQKSLVVELGFELTLCKVCLYNM